MVDVCVKRFLLLFASVVAAIAVVLGVLAYTAWRASQQVPDFYQEALLIEPDAGAKAGEELEQQVFNLQNDLQHQGKWQALFTEEQVNGWLAVDFVQKFPRVLPKGVTDPRVSIQEDRVLLACRYTNPRFSSVFSLHIEPYLTDQPNELAIRIHKARAGVLVPVPLKQVLDGITKMASKHNVPLRWQQTDGDPVALITLPVRHHDMPKELHLEAIELRDGEILIAGRTADGDSSDGTPLDRIIIGQTDVKISRHR